jgi:hypothetical protein
VNSLQSSSTSWDSKIKHMRTPIYSFVSNEASVIEHIAHIYFPIYSVDVVLHACVNGCAPMLRFTRIGISFLETLESLGNHHRFRIA